MDNTLRNRVGGWCRIALLLTLTAALVVGCGPRTETAVLVGVKASFGLDDAMGDGLTNEDIEFAGVVVLERGDGSRVEAICDKELWPQLRGEQTLEIAPIEDSDSWKVIRIVE